MRIVCTGLQIDDFATPLMHNKVTEVMYVNALRLNRLRKDPMYCEYT